MPYIGQHPFQEYTNTPTKDSFTGDGSTTAFDMAVEVSSGAENALEVYVDNIRQEPGIGKAFTLGLDGSSNYTRITFTAAPANGSAIYVINDKTNTSVTAPLAHDLNGTELILDGDADTSITADSDDRIDYKIGGVEAFSFSESSGDTVVKVMTDAKDILFQQYDGRNVLEINDAGFVGLHNGSTGSGELRIYEDDDAGSNYSGFKVGTQSADVDYVLPTGDGTSGYHLTTNGSGTLSWAASNGNPSSADGDSLGTAALEWSDLFLADASTIQFGADQDVTLTHVHNTGLLLNSTMALQFNDASQYINAPSATVLDITATDEIELNATLIDINGNLDVSGTITIGSAEISEAELEIIDGATVTTAELNIMDGDTSATSTTVADADRVVMNDAGNMVQVAVTDLAAYFDDEITAMPNLVTTAATTVGVLASGSITTGFGNIDNGTSNITSGGLVSIDADADADDISADSSTGRLTLGASGDLNLYHGGTNSYIVNSTGDLIIQVGASDEDFIIQGNDGGSAITALTLDMSNAGKATFNDGVVATTGTFSGALAGTLSTAAQTNITSLGTLTALTVDDVAVNGKVITMTGSASDTAVLTAGTNGTLSIVTTDAAAAAANITITADGTAELAGTTVTLNSSGGVTLDADNGTITFADAGSSLGTITSSGYSGTAAVATTVTITDNESTDENNAIIFTAGGDLDGGNLGLESDGDLHYNPNTGTLSVTNIVTSGTHTVTNSVTMNASNAVIFEGATADAYETTLTSVDATGSDKTVSLPNVSGTLPVLAAASTTAITTTPAELNLIDGGTARGTDAVASGDGILINDGGTMKMTNVDTVSTYFASHNVGGGNLVTTGALGSGSIATGFGNIDNGASNITSGGLVKLDVDADADDISADSATGRLTLGASSDLNLYHGGTNSYIVNSTGDLILVTGASDEDMLFKGNDGGSVITALTLDMSAAGAASFNGAITANAGVVVDNITIDGTTIALSSGDLLFDVAGDIVLDADGGDIIFKDAGTQISRYRSVSENLYINVDVSDKDFIVQGNDGGSGITAMTLDMSAAGAATFNNDVTAFSDERLKSNIETIPNALETVLQMRGVNFTRDDNDDKPGTGVIAQEIQEVFPVVVKENTDEDKTLSVSYGNMVGILIEAIKEQQKQIEELKNN